MKTKINITFLFVALLTFQDSFGQNTPEDIVNKFFTLYKNESSDKAIDYIFSTVD